MPTSKPRITITLTEHQHHILQSMSAYQGASMSSIVTDLLETAVPVLERVLVILQAAEAAPRESLDKLKESLQGAEELVREQFGSGIRQLDLLVDAAAASAGDEHDAAASRKRSKRADPPASNRGVRNTSKTGKKPLKSTTSRGGKK